MAGCTHNAAANQEALTSYELLFGRILSKVSVLRTAVPWSPALIFTSFSLPFRIISIDPQYYKIDIHHFTPSDFHEKGPRIVRQFVPNCKRS